jgi:hypothetical protein
MVDVILGRKNTAFYATKMRFICLFGLERDGSSIIIANFAI